MLRYVTLPVLLATKLHDFEVTVLLGLHILLRQSTATVETQHARVHIAMSCRLEAQDSRYNEESLCWSVCSGVIRPISTFLHWVMVGLSNECARLTLGFLTVSD